MHKIQLKLVELSARKNISGMSLRSIGREVGVENAATIKYHLEQLKNKGLIKKQPTNNVSSLREKILRSQDSLVNIPILGSANCGVAMLMAEEMLEGYLKISSKLLPGSNHDNLFAVKAEGDSMNLANIKGHQIEEGDYLIIDTNNINPRDGDYVLSVIDGCANIKKMIRDKNNRIVLVSESTRNYPPIYIHPNDSYLINGAVISVIKNPNFVS